MSLCAEGAEGPGVNDPNAGGCTGLGSVSDCPFNFWRTTGDPEPGWGTIMRELNTLRTVVNPAYASGMLTSIGLEACATDKPEQQWGLSFDDNHSMMAVKSVSTGGCWEIPGCDSSEHASIDTDFGCKALPKSGQTGCPANMACEFSASSASGAYD